MSNYKPSWDRKNLQALQTAMKQKIDQINLESLAKILQTQANKKNSKYHIAYEVDNSNQQLSAELRYNGRESI